MTRYGMAIDLNRCMGCQTCAMYCKAANNLPNDVWYQRVVTEGGGYTDASGGTSDDPKLGFRPIACQHCDEPACAAVCPVGATYKDPDTGVVMQDTSICIGCQSCMQACPYDVRTYIDDPEYSLDFAVGYQTAPEHRPSTVEKCNFCAARLDEGEEPACMILCPARARYYGDLDDPQSAVNKAMAGRETEQLLPEEGTSPCVYYLV